jgi:hypothetical protein
MSQRLRWPPDEADLEELDLEREPAVPGATTARQAPSRQPWPVAHRASRIVPDAPNARLVLSWMRRWWPAPAVGVLLAAALGWRLVTNASEPRPAAAPGATQQSAPARVADVQVTSEEPKTPAVSRPPQAVVAAPDARAPILEAGGSDSASPIVSVPSVASPSTAGAARPPDSSLLPAAAPGFLSVPLPIQVEVYEGTRFIGINDSSRMALTAGAHRLDFMNDSLRFHTSQRVEISSGRTTTLRIGLPTGTLNLNAVPWADVAIDGKAAGQTPLGNVRVPIGPHRIVFRHPQLGEQTRAVVVTRDSKTRVAVDLRPNPS